MQLNWMRCRGDIWCRFNSVNLEHRHFENKQGVYIIWHGGGRSKVVYVGQGNIRERLEHHRTNPEIQKYENFNLYVTWASVLKEYRNGIERYLAEYWQPLIGGRFPDCDPIEVNSPW